MTHGEMFAALTLRGGCIVSSGDCSEMEQAEARTDGRFFVDDEGLGFVLRRHEWLQKHSRFATGATDPCEGLEDNSADG